MTVIIDGTAGITFNNSTIQASAGSVIQVVNATLSSDVSTSSSTPVTTGLSASITPKFSTSKVLILVGGGTIYNNGTTGQQVSLTIFKNGSNLVASNAMSLAYSSLSALQVPISLTYYDSPATTSSTTYAVYFASTNTAGSVQLLLNNTKMSINLLEIAA